MRRTFLAMIPALACAGCFGGSVAPPPGPIAQMNQEGVRRLERADLAGAEEMFARALWEAELRDDLDDQGEAWNNMGALARARGKPAEALALHRRALALHGDAAKDDAHRASGTAIARTRGNIAACLIALGKPAEARAEIESAIATWKALDDRGGEARARVALSAALLAEKNPAEALVQAREARRLIGDDNDPGTRAACFANEAAALEAQKDLSGARAAYAQALDLDRGRDAPGAIAGDLRSLARVAETQQNPGDAADLRARASRVLRRLGDLEACEKELTKAILLFERAKKTDDARACQAELDALRAERASQAARATK